MLELDGAASHGEQQGTAAKGAWGSLCWFEKTGNMENKEQQQKGRCSLGWRWPECWCKGQRQPEGSTGRRRLGGGLELRHYPERRRSRRELGRQQGSTLEEGYLGCRIWVRKKWAAPWQGRGAAMWPADARETKKSSARELGALVLVEEAREQGRQGLDAAPWWRSWGKGNQEQQQCAVLGKKKALAAATGVGSYVC